MRVIEPRSYKGAKPKKRYMVKLIFLLIIFTIAIFSYKLISNKNSEKIETVVAEELANNENNEKVSPPQGPIEFSGNEFRLLYDNLLLPNTQKINTPPVISGNDIADARIRLLAETSGYKIRTTIQDDLPLVDGYKLQSSVRIPWDNMQKAASNEGIFMSIVSGYRSINEQKELFVNRLNTEGVSITDVANGLADDEIIKVLTTTSIPGYSKHHSGYTIDLLCSGWSFDDFDKSNCNEWLVANNYENAKKYGFIPSYPLDADLQGPEPEAWEYVYVGTENLIP
jgi:LAS superfamily LD-carboxypeptidase LdcB